MKERITAAELKAMTMKELAAWVEFNACAINRTMVMSWGHEELFKGYHIRPEYTGYIAGRLMVKAFHFTSRTRKADAQSFAEWLHWAIFGEYPAEETAETAEQVEETETEETEAETIEENAEEAKEVVTMKKYFKVTFKYADGIYCANLAHAETAEDVEREYSKYPWRSIKEAQPWDVEEAKMKGMPIIEVEAAPAEDPEAVTLAPAEDAQVWDENGETVTPDTDTEEEEEEKTMENISAEARELGYLATQYEKYGSVDEEEIIEAYIDEKVEVDISMLGDYNNYLANDNRYDDEIMDWDELEDYLKDMPPLDAFKLAHNSDFTWNDNYFTWNGYGNLVGMDEYAVVDKIKEDRDFLKWYVTENELIDDDTMEEAINYCNHLLKEGY